jgi:hypothetical protein
MLLELYTDISDNSLPILSRDSAIEILSKKGYIIGQVTNIEGIDSDIVRLNVSFNEDAQTSTVYIDKQGRYSCELSSLKDTEQAKAFNTSRNRLKRNALLLDSDWIENSPSVTTRTKEQYKAFRQYLRDIFDYQDVTTFIDFPLPPSIVAKTTQQSQITDNEVLLIKKYTPLDKEVWYTFLAEWSKTNYNPSRTLIVNLLKAYTSLTLTDVLK